MGGLLLGLAILKLTAGDALWAHPLRTQYLTALIGESAAGFHLLVKPRALVSWLLACGLCGLLFIYAWLGPPLRDCLCLGFLAELGPRGRSSLAGGLLAVSLAGVAVLRWNPGIRTS